MSYVVRWGDFEGDSVAVTGSHLVGRFWAHSAQGSDEDEEMVKSSSPGA